MECLYCRCSDTRVIDSRETEGGTRRRRECVSCEKRFTTYERVEGVPLTVCKKNGKREPFDRAKLCRGLMRACEKTSLMPSDVEEIMDKVELRLRGLASTDVTSKRIGSLAMQYLKSKDKIAYIRFASVYREFADLEDFHMEVERLIAQKNKRR